MKLKLVALGIAAGMLLVESVRTASARITQPPASVSADSEEMDQTQDTAAQSHPYSAIFSRNVFHLVPQPPPVSQAPAEDPAAASTLKLTGLLKARGQPARALFVNQPKGATNSIFYNLSVGERDGALELLGINETEESVEVVHAGIRQTVLLKDNKPTTTPGAGPAAVPGLPTGRGGPAGVITRLSSQPATPPPTPAPQPTVQSPLANVSQGSVLVGGGSVPQPQLGTAAATNAAVRSPIPTRTMRNPVTPAPPGGAIPNEPAGATPVPGEQPIMPQEQ